MKSNIYKIAATSLLLLAFAVNVQATTITSCTLDRETYEQGETGYVSLTVYNNMDDTIRVTEVTAMIDYYYADGTMYSQTFFTNITLPVEILQSQSSIFIIPFSLPTNIASGYARLFCRARTDLWNTQSQRWYSSDNPTAESILYIESPYKHQFEEQQAVNQQLQNQLTEQQAVNQQLQNQLTEQQSTISQLEADLQSLQISHNNTTLAMYILIVITIALGATMALLMKITSKPRQQSTPVPQ